jgi:S1-C subfamily serine protease
MTRLISIFLLALPALFGGSLHDDVLHTQVRVRTQTAGGSGTVIYSEKTSDGFFSTYVITCHHVIEDAMKLETQWDPMLQKDRKREERQPVDVEWFGWDQVPHGRAPLTSGTRAEIVTHSQKHDMALLHLRLVKKPQVAKMLPKGRYEEVRVGAPVWAVGCALGHDPILTSGVVTQLGDILAGQDYVMSSAQIIFGNSGGGLFLDKGSEYYFIGIPSAGDVVFGTPITHLGYSSPIWRIHEFLEEQVFDFLVPGSGRTEAQCAADRDKKRELEEKKLRLE